MTALELSAQILGALLCAAAGAAGHWAFARRRHRGTEERLGTRVEQATFDTLHRASLAAPPLRAGLTPETARKAARRLRSLLGTPVLCLTSADDVLAWDGSAEHHRASVMALAAATLKDGRPRAVSAPCDQPGCAVQRAVVAPLTVDSKVLGCLVALGPQETPMLLRATGEVARWVSVQLELAELERARSRLIEAEIRTLRAQISPHFIFNSLAAIASFVRTDPQRARDLLLEFADFTRYSFRRHGDFTTLADELGSIDQYLNLVRARFGERLQVTLRVAPEVLPVALPFLCLQPLVENAVKHGIEGRPGRSRITITADDDGAEARVVIRDDGVGMDPERLRAVLSGEGGPSTGIGLGNVDERLRQVYGPDHGLVIETAAGAGMRITVRLPKFHPGVHADGPDRQR
ncbi:sensor histidine kinase [Streptacidiphilus sp. PB12-B1b]|uniref:sensor histidine kinase n=1 Tax=Streptacidiphilus sp. PB12-B1b TaxID=2705012 RepID=UPI0015FDDC28|nr:histidine kinase [Streptacidiphilus sp. PB12-B1b]QMU77944.1 sensor histidine kinase [Streptacidiphilus sp. PB12-B1b]